MLVTPSQKGDGVYTSSKIDNYLKWLNSKTGTNFSKERDLRVKTVNLAQNINCVGETAFCTKPFKWFILESTLVWFKEKQRFLKPIKSNPVFFIDGDEQVLNCTAAINPLLSYWSIEITKQKEADLYKTLVTIYGDEQAEIILAQLILTNAVGDIQYQELKK